MGIRLWPSDYEKKTHLNKAEKALLKISERNFKDGHIVVNIDPLGMSTDKVKMGMYISPREGLITFSLYNGTIKAKDITSYLAYVHVIEDRVYERLLDAKVLIVRNGENKVLKFPYKHIFMFPDERIGKTTLSENEKDRLLNYVTYSFFRPITSKGKEKRVVELKIFDGIRKPFDSAFEYIDEKECRAIFERLAPEYTVVLNEKENITIEEKNTTDVIEDLTITGNEHEYKTFFLDDYQVAQVNDMGKGHRVILANPGAGKSVLLLSKSFKYASMYKDSKVLLTCYNNNLAESYNFKKACADFGDNRNLFILTFHKLVEKIYKDCLKQSLESFYASDEEIQRCIDMVENGRIKLRFKAIFIDEVQNFNPLYLELCYRLLEDSKDRTFLMAGDLNQSIRSKSRKGEVPWKQMNGISLDFTGRVKYIEKNYRNSKEIGEYIYRMLNLMNTRFDMLNLINEQEFDYNTFTLSEKPTTALVVKTGIDRIDIKNKVIEAIQEITQKYGISYSDIAVLFPFRRREYLRYYFMYWLSNGLDEKDIPYSMIINDNTNRPTRTRVSSTTGVIISTIESSLGLDFKAVILAGLYPYNYVNVEERIGTEIKTWAGIQKMTDAEQSAVQSQMRSIYTACSRARDVLYVLSDLKTGNPMDELLKA